MRATNVNSKARNAMENIFSCKHRRSRGSDSLRLEALRQTSGRAIAFCHLLQLGWLPLFYPGMTSLSLLSVLCKDAIFSLALCHLTSLRAASCGLDASKYCLSFSALLRLCFDFSSLKQIQSLPFCWTRTSRVRQWLRSPASAQVQDSEPLANGHNPRMYAKPPIMSKRTSFPL
jgi:hypothetical protein